MTIFNYYSVDEIEKTQHGSKFENMYFFTEEVRTKNINFDQNRANSKNANFDQNTAFSRSTRFWWWNFGQKLTVLTWLLKLLNSSPVEGSKNIDFDRNSIFEIGRFRSQNDHIFISPQNPGNSFELFISTHKAHYNQLILAYRLSLWSCFLVENYK